MDPIRPQTTRQQLKIWNLLTCLVTLYTAEINKNYFIDIICEETAFGAYRYLPLFDATFRFNFVSMTSAVIGYIVI